MTKINILKRTSTDKCLLCGINDATETGSHFTPEHLLRSSIGKRGMEFVGMIDLNTGSTNAVYGQSRLDNPSIEPRHIHHVADYIFCPVCEDRFGKLESEIGLVITTKLFNPNQAQNFPERQIGPLKYRECLKVSGNVFGLYIYSVIYRILLQQALTGSGGILSPQFVATVRKVILDNIDKDFKTIQIEFPYKFTVMACPDRGKESVSNVHPHLVDTNPFLFFIGNFFVLIEHDDYEKSDSIKPFSPEILNTSLLNGDIGYTPKIVFLSEEQTENVYAHLLELVKNKD